jgi:hypothetical protein
MIGFKTLYDEATEAEYFVSSASLTDEAYNPQGKNMYQVDLTPFDDCTPCLYNVPLMIDHASNEYYMPELSDIIYGDDYTYDFNSVSKHNLVNVSIDDDMIIMPYQQEQEHEQKQEQEKGLIIKAINKLIELKASSPGGKIGKDLDEIITYMTGAVNNG